MWTWNDILSELAYVRNIGSKEKIENFDNAVEFLHLKALCYRLEAPTMSNWKIISNCCLPIFLREVLVNYASNMICIRLYNRTIHWKQWEFLHGVKNLQNFLSVGVIRRFIFSFIANQNFSRDRKVELLCKSIALVLQMKFHFMGCLVKANALVSGNT